MGIQYHVIPTLEAGESYSFASHCGVYFFSEYLSQPLSAMLLHNYGHQTMHKAGLSQVTNTLGTEKNINIAFSSGNIVIENLTDKAAKSILICYIGKYKIKFS